MPIASMTVLAFFHFFFNFETMSFPVLSILYNKNYVSAFLIFFINTSGSLMSYYIFLKFISVPSVEIQRTIGYRCNCIICVPCFNEGQIVQLLACQSRSRSLTLCLCPLIRYVLIIHIITSIFICSHEND